MRARLYGRPDPWVLAVPPDLTEEVRRAPVAGIDRLVRHLLEGTSEDRTRVKRIHDWIATNVSYDVEQYRSGHGVHGTWLDTLKNGRAVCAGFASLFAEMALRAGIEVAEVHGYARGADFRMFDLEDPSTQNHAWNAVRIDGRWHLVDATWGAGSLAEEGTFERRYSSDHLLTPPEQWIHTHFPANPDWQLLARPISAERFRALPYVTGAAFASGLVVVEPVQRISAVATSARIRLKAPEGRLVTASVEDATHAKVPRCTMVHRRGRAVTIEAVFPGPGRWSVHLFVKRASAPQTTPHREVARFGYLVAQGTLQRVPETSGLYSRLGCRLLEPTRTPLKQLRRTRFRIRVPGRHRIALITEDQKWHHLRKTWFGAYVTSKRVSPRGAKLVVDDGDDGKWATLVEF